LSSPPETAEKRLAAAASLAMVGAVLVPLIENWREKPKDSFPLSYYPMFSAKRPKRVKLTYLVGFDAAGARYTLPYAYAGSGGLNQVRRQIVRAVADGRADVLCAHVAAQVAHVQPVTPTEVITVQVVSGSYRLKDFLAGKKEPVSEEVHATATCPARSKTPLPMSTLEVA